MLGSSRPSRLNHVRSGPGATDQLLEPRAEGCAQRHDQEHEPARRRGERPSDQAGEQPYRRDDKHDDSPHREDRAEEGQATADDDRGVADNPEGLGAEP